MWIVVGWVVISVPLWLICLVCFPHAFNVYAYHLHPIFSVLLYGFLIWFVIKCIINARDNCHIAEESLDTLVENLSAEVTRVNLLMTIVGGIGVILVFPLIWLIWCYQTGDLAGPVLGFTVFLFPIMIPLWFVAIFCAVTPRSTLNRLRRIEMGQE
jgi:hypothetical protein